MTIETIDDVLEGLVLSGAVKESTWISRTHQAASWPRVAEDQGQLAHLRRCTRL